MEKKQVLDALSTLASGVRLDAYRLLVSKGHKGLVSGEIAAALNLPLTNTSFHLKSLVQAGLATVEQEGRFQRYPRLKSPSGMFIRSVNQRKNGGINSPNGTKCCLL